MRLLRHWKIVGVLALVFIAGAVTGGAVTHIVSQRAALRSMKIEFWKEHALRDLDQKLHLTEDQRARVAGILDNGGEQMRGVFSRTLQDCGRIIVDMQRSVDQELTAEQKVRHAQMKRAFRTELKRKLNYDLPAE